LADIKMTGNAKQFIKKSLKICLIFQLVLLTRDLFTEDETLLVGYSSAYSKWCEIIAYTLPDLG